MRKRLLKRLLWILGVPLVTAAYGFAQVIGPLPVIDVAVLTKIITETLQVIQVATNTLSTYQQLVFEGQYLTNKSAWRGAIVGVAGSYFPSTPVTSPWAATAMSGLAAARGYGNAAVALQQGPAAVLLGGYRAPFYASAQLGAAGNTAALETLGDTRTFAGQMLQPIQNCENSALSGGLNDNTDAAQMNITNGCQVLALRHQQAQLNVDTARLEVELFRSKVEADNMADYQNMLTQSELAPVTMPQNFAGTLTNYSPK